jgi:hypothetical protein
LKPFTIGFFAQLLLNVPTLRLLAPSTSINQIIVGSYSQVLLVHIPHFFRSHSRRSPFFNSRSNLEIHRRDGGFLQGLPGASRLLRAFLEMYWVFGWV